MVEDPVRFIDPFIEAGANLLLFHIESQTPVGSILQQIHRQGCAAGLACNPDTPFEKLLPWLDQIDLLLLMTVQPGFSGQAFCDDVLSKIKKASALRHQHPWSFRLGVDGGINILTAEKCLDAGADILVSGTSFFDPAQQEALLKLFPLKS
jgi:ribulose-phosphate 3-epimerase